MVERAPEERDTGVRFTYMAPHETKNTPPNGGVFFVREASLSGSGSFPCLPWAFEW